MFDAHIIPSIAVIVLFAGLVALWIAAVVSIVRTDLVEPLVKALWIIAVIAFTFVGPVVWFAVKGYQGRRRDRSATPLAA